MIKFQLRYNKAFTDRGLLCRNCCLCNENSALLLPVFHLDVAICADHPNLPALCFNRGTPPPPRGHTLVALRWTSDEKRRSGAQLSCQREAAKTCLRWNYTAARSAYQRAAKADRNRFTYSAIYGQKESQSKVNGHDGHEARRLGSRQVGLWHFPLIDWRTCLKIVQFLCHHWQRNTGFQEKQVTAPPYHANIQW